MADSDNKEIKERLAALLTQTDEQSAVRPNLGEMNFSDILPSIQGAKKVAALIKDLNFDLVPRRKTKDLSNRIQELINSLKQMDLFKISAPDAPQKRNQIQSDIEGKINTFFEAAHPLVAIGIASSDTKISEQATRQTLEKLLNEITEAAKKAQEGLEAVRSVAAQAGVSKESTHFAKEATDHKTASGWWLAWTIFFVVATAGWGVVALWFFGLNKDATNAEIATNALSKLIILSGLYYGLVWCARNYRASLHNYVVNKHRQNSLSTFEAFVKAAEKDEGTKNAVLLQATTSIFTSQPSGYVTSESEPDHPSRIVEITKSISGKN